MVSSLADSFDFTFPSFEIYVSDILPPPEYNVDAWNFVCGAHSIEKLD